MPDAFETRAVAVDATYRSVIIEASHPRIKGEIRRVYGSVLGYERPL